MCDVNMKTSLNRNIILDKTLLFKLELNDGTCQWLQIPELQARSLGLQIDTNPKPPEKVPVITTNVNPQITSIPDIEVTDKVQEDTAATQIVYKIVKPEDLNLKSVMKTHLPRGRPRKRSNQKINFNDTESPDGPKRVIKEMRTRSGRITKPPKHIEKDFKKIDISEDDKSETDIKTSEFEPLTTNETPTEEPLQILEQHSKKRHLSSHFKCPTCNKMYLGRLRMLKHFHKHPDHGSSPNYCKLKHNTTWNFLILTSRKYKEGPKGAKFCQELDVLLQNAKELAQFLFKPVKNDEQGYFINDTLAYIFGISPGHYDIDETELNRNLAFNENLESNGNNCENIIDKSQGVNNTTDTLQHSASENSVNNDRQNGKIAVHNGNIQDNFNSFDYMINPNETHNISNYDAITKNVKSEDDLNLCNINMNLNTQSNNSDLEFPITHRSHDMIMDKESSKNNGSANSFINSQTSQHTPINNGKSLALVKYEMHKHNLYFANQEYVSINNSFDNAIDANHLTNMTEYNNLNIKQKSVFNIDDHKHSTDTSRQLSEKQSNHITLQNELHDVDELILGNVDTGQVSSILDTSSNSDDIMNVDQFVNERFKKLTETDMDIQSNLLNLELLPLDIFQFHTS